MSSHGEVISSCLRRTLASDETAPGFVTLVNDLGSILPIFCFARESESVLGFAVGNLVNPVMQRDQRRHQVSDNQLSVT